MNPIEERLGAWLSAALDDPNACEEFKKCIREWFEFVENREYDEELQRREDDLRSMD